MKAIGNVTDIKWDTATDDGDTTGVDSLPKAPFSFSVEVDDKDEGTVVYALLDHLMDTYGFFILHIDYVVVGYTNDVDETSHYS